MNLLEFLSTKKFNLTGNIDERYFRKEDDGTYKATPLFIHNVARDIVNDIKTIIIGTDDPKYVVHRDNGGKGYDVNDSWAKHEHDVNWQIKYKNQIEAATKKYNEYRDAHLDEYNQNAPTIATGDVPTTRFFSAYHPDFGGMSNSELMAMYKEAKELQQKYEGELKETLPLRPGNYVSKPEFKDAHNAVRAKIAKEVGLPEDNYSVPTIHKDERLELIRSNSKEYKSITNADGTAFEDYINGLVAHITSSTPDAYQKEWERLNADINEACERLARGGRGSKLVVSKSSSTNAMNISIYTADKDEGSTRHKLANISKVNPDDAFYTFTLFLTCNGKRPVRPIATKAELRKVLEDLIVILEFNELNMYVDCVQNAIDAIC